MKFPNLIPFFLGSVILVLTWLLSPPAWALTPINLSELSYHECPPELAEGSVMSGDVEPANCFVITGQAQNPTNKTIYNADIFGRVFDANGEPIAKNRGRLGSIPEIPPGKTDFELRISVSKNQPPPLTLEQFKASGFTGTVRR